MTNLDKISHKLMDSNHRLKAKCGLMEREIERLSDENEQLKLEIQKLRKDEHIGWKSLPINKEL